MSSLSASFEPSVPYSEIASIREALQSAKGQSPVEFALKLPRDVAEKVLSLLNLERTSGAVIIPAKDEFTPAGAAVILGVSRQTIVRMITNGEFQARKVGQHWRISAEDLRNHIEVEQQNRKTAADRLAMLTAE